MQCLFKDSFKIFWLSTSESFRMSHIGSFKFGQIFTPVKQGEKIDECRRLIQVYEKVPETETMQVDDSYEKKIDCLQSGNKSELPKDL